MLSEKLGNPMFIMESSGIITLLIATGIYLSSSTISFKEYFMGWLFLWIISGFSFGFWTILKYPNIENKDELNGNDSTVKEQMKKMKE